MYRCVSAGGLSALRGESVGGNAGVGEDLPSNWRHTFRLGSGLAFSMSHSAVALLPGGRWLCLIGGFDLFPPCLCPLSPWMDFLGSASVVTEWLPVICALWAEHHFLWRWNGSNQHLDFMFITESWTKVGDLTPFSELVPADCTFFNSPHPNRKGGGLVTILKYFFWALSVCF